MVTNYSKDGDNGSVILKLSDNKRAQEEIINVYLEEEDITQAFR
jgi:hypothetical protein